MKHKITLGKADEGDIEEICRLADDVMCRYEDFSSIDREKALGWTHLTIASNIQNNVTFNLEGHKAGYYLISRNGDDDLYEIYHLFVFENMQGKGIGTAIVHHILHETNGRLFVYIYTGDISTYTMFANMGFMIQEIYHRTRYKMVYHPREMAEYTGCVDSLLDDSEDI